MGNLPRSWKGAIVIPEPKSGKDTTNPGNYRPIALNSCICKTMESMVQDRLVWFLKKNKLITTVQSGFRNHISTIDHIWSALKLLFVKLLLKVTCSLRLLWLRKCIWHDWEVWNCEWPLWFWHKRSPCLSYFCIFCIFNWPSVQSSYW